jgi:hypothetical protein
MSSAAIENNTVKSNCVTNDPGGWATLESEPSWGKGTAEADPTAESQIQNKKSHDAVY